MIASPPNRRGIASAIRNTFWNVGYTISLNLAILLMSFTLPYQTVSSLISSNTASITTANRVLFIESLRATYFWLAVISGLAILPSLLGSKRSFSRKEKPIEKASRKI
jgi:hypothetical protein